MHFILFTSLKKQALLTIAVKLWERDLHSVTKACLQYNFRHYQQVKSKLITHVQKLVLPKILKTELTRFVDGIGSELLLWFRLVGIVCGGDNLCAVAAKIFWSSHGTINLKKTVETLLQVETINILYLYRLAYICCLEESITSLWRQLPKIQQRLYPMELCDEFNLQLLYYAGERCRYGGMWLNTDFPPYRYGLYHSVCNGIDTSVKYYLQKLENEEDNEYLLTSIYLLLKTVRAKDFDGASTRILCYLLNEIEEEKQIELLKKHPFEVLLLFLNWPMQVYFTKIHEYVGSLLKVEEFYELLKRMVLKRREYPSFECDQIFEEIWKQSSVAHRRYVIEHYATFSDEDDWVPCCLFELQYWKTFNLLLKDATVEERRKIIFHPKMCDAYRNAITGGNHDAMDSFVRDCLISREEIIELKQKMEDRWAWYKCRKKFRKINLKWKNLFTSLDSLINNKRKLIIEGVDTQKRRCVAKC